MEKIKKCGGVKNCNAGINRMKKEEQRDNFRVLLGFKENDIMNGEKYTVSNITDRASVCK